MEGKSSRMIPEMNFWSEVWETFKVLKSADVKKKKEKEDGAKQVPSGWW